MWACICNALAVFQAAGLKQCCNRVQAAKVPEDLVAEGIAVVSSTKNAVLGKDQKIVGVASAV